MRATDQDNLYIGGAGEFRVMAELLAWGSNIAVPASDDSDEQSTDCFTPSGP